MLQLENTKVEKSAESGKITMVLLGKNSNDKCTIGNSILKAEHFIAGKDTCTTAEERVDDQTVCVINTPELFHKSNTKQETDSIEEIKPLYPGRRAFLLVLHDKKLSPEEMEMFSQLKERFGEKMVENTIVVLVSNQEKESGEPYEQADENLKKLLDECGRRMCVHNQKEAVKDNELTKQVMDKWKAIHERKDYELCSTAIAEEGLYEEIDPYIPLQPKPQEPRTYETSTVQTVQMSGSDYMMTMVLLGNNSYNKCLIGNTILNQHFFQPQVTCEKIVHTVHGQKVCIINTPDFFHKLSSPKADSMEELKPSYAGPRAFLLVLQDKRVSSEDMEMFTELKKKLGEKMVEHTIVLVEKTLSSNSMDKRLSFKKHYYAILNECGNRKCAYFKHMKNAELIKKLNKYTRMQNHQASDVRRLDNVVAMQTPTNHMSSSVKVHPLKAMTIVLLGQTGSGKSATGNTILKKQHFESHASSLPVTKRCQMAEEMIFEKKIRVIDTPDFFNEDLQNQEDQIKKCKELAQPGPDVYLLVMQLGRFTDGEREVLPHLKREFGEDLTSKTVVLFTGKEKLKDRTLLDYINGSDKELQELIKTCHSRCYAINNNEKRHHQVKKLLDVIADMQGNIAFGKHHKRNHNEMKDCNIL